LEVKPTGNRIDIHDFPAGTKALSVVYHEPVDFKSIPPRVTNSSFCAFFQRVCLSTDWISFRSCMDKSAPFGFGLIPEASTALSTSGLGNKWDF
jgi:hypothetical protein